jgi:signal transduction histidine kinase
MPVPVPTRISTSITARTLLVSALLGALLSASFVLLVIAVTDQRDAGRLALRSQQAITAGAQLEKSVNSLETGLRGFVASGKSESLAPYNAARRVYPVELRKLRAMVSGDPIEVQQVGKISEAIDDYISFWAVPLLAIALDRPNAARAIIVNRNGRARVAQIRNAFNALFERERSVARARESRAEHRTNLARAMGIGGAILALALSLLVAIALRRFILRPVEDVTRATEAVAGGDLTVRVRSPRRDELGRLGRAFNAMTEQLQARTSDLERSNRDLEDYAAVASHDLQGPLATIGMHAELLQRRLGKESGQEAMLAERIVTSSRSMTALVRALLAYSRAGSAQPRHERIALDEVVERAVDNLAAPIAEAQADVGAEPLPEVLGDSAMLAQVFQNLIGNAVKFADGHTPVVRVRSEPDGEHRVRVSVEDEGIGIAPDEAERIFRPFHRLHGDDRYEGSGIGLAICRRVVEAHGGRIWAEPRPGGGTAFRLTLPLAAG